MSAPDTARAETPRVVTLGEAMGLLRATDVGSLAQLGTVAVSTGGAEANVAIGLARLGVRAAWLGRVGDDSLGRRVARELRAEGVETHAVVDPGAPTGLMLKETPAPGRTRVTFYRRDSAGSRLDEADLDRLDIAGASLLHLTGILPALSERAARTAGAALDRADRSGVPVSFDVNHRQSLWSVEAAAPVYRRLAARARILFGGVDELGMLVGEQSDDRALADAAAALGPREVVVKRGADGAGVLCDGEWFELPAEHVTVVDTVGAGDAFVAGYLAERMRGQAPDRALATAVRTGAAACQSPGDWEGSPYLADLAAPAPLDVVLR